MLSVWSARIDEGAQDRQARVDHRRELPRRRPRASFSFTLPGRRLISIFTPALAFLTSTGVMPISRSFWRTRVSLSPTSWPVTRSPSGPGPCSRRSAASLALLPISTRSPSVIPAAAAAPCPGVEARRSPPPMSRFSSSASWQRSYASCWRDLARLHEVRERLVHRLHAEPAAGLHDRVDLVDLALADQVADRGRGDQDLDRDAPAAPVGRLEQLLGHDALERRRELDADLLLLVRREHVDDAVDRLRRVLRVQRGEDEVPGLGRGDRGRDRLEVAHLADEDDVGVLAQDVLEGRRERSACRRRPRAGSRCSCLCLCRNSIGSSTVMMCAGRSRFTMSTIAASVVDLPEPVGPVTTTNPRG